MPTNVNVVLFCAKADVASRTVAVVAVAGASDTSKSATTLEEAKLTTIITTRKSLLAKK